jgi:hypothetical protein
VVDAERIQTVTDVLTQLRQACAEVSRRAGHVRVNHDAIPDYAAAIPLGNDPSTADETPPGTREHRAAFWLTLDAINFGSGWFPTLNKRPGYSGYHTIAAGIQDRFAREGPWTAEELAAITPNEIAETLAQDPTHELMHLFACSLGDLGRHIADDCGGRFEAAVGDSAVAMVETLAAWQCFADTSTYDDLTLPFLKRAQIAAADLHRAGVAHLTDVGRLTMFADNLVPHVLRLDGILDFEPALSERIENERLIEHGSPEEVEIRACALRAVELIVGQCRQATSAARVDQLLWLRGQDPRYKARPRHRSRTTAY